jgi:hypothetical protein
MAARGNTVQLRSTCQKDIRNIWNEMAIASVSEQSELVPIRALWFM